MPKTVLITRPLPQAHMLARACLQAGYDPVIFPILAIEKLKPQWPTTLDTFTKIIFVSPNAVHAAFETLQLPSTVEVYAIGSGTAHVLHAYGVANVIFPDAGEYASEGLLALASLQDLTGQTIIIVRGENGRTLLAETLTARGAKVEQVITYRREPVPLTYKPPSTAVIIATSAEILAHLKALAEQHGLMTLIEPILVVSSQRLKEHAIELGYKNRIILAKNASNDAIMLALSRLNDNKDS